VTSLKVVDGHLTIELPWVTNYERLGPRARVGNCYRKDPFIFDLHIDDDAPDFVGLGFAGAYDQASHNGNSQNEKVQAEFSHWSTALSFTPFEKGADRLTLRFRELSQH
jgi:hypothetical protein